MGVPAGLSRPWRTDGTHSYAASHPSRERKVGSQRVNSSNRSKTIPVSNEAIMPARCASLREVQSNSRSKPVKPGTDHTTFQADVVADDFLAVREMDSPSR